MPEMRNSTVTEHSIRSGDHVTFYLAAGPRDGPLIIFIHGWPELALSWRHVLPRFGGLGFRAIAPDMRGYGRSTVYGRHDAYAQRHVVADMIALLDALGGEKAVWVGHDWGSATAWSIASHHPERCSAVASLCVPYRTIERGTDHLVSLVDREIYPEADAPSGQWAYMRFYHERFQRATAVHDADPCRTIKALFRRGKPNALGKPSPHMQIFANNGWFGGGDIAPDVDRDPAVVSEQDLCSYAESLGRNGFYGPNSYYMNDADNLAYSDESADGGRLTMPVLFIAGRYDITCESVESRLADPMRESCEDLTFETVESGHWMAQEKPDRVNAILTKWLADKVPSAWPREMNQARP